MKEAYAAGLIDGEGSFGIYQKGGGLVCTLTVGMNDQRPLLMLQEIFGGRLRNKPISSPKQEQAFEWRLDDREKIQAAVRRIEPFLISKKVHAILMIEFIERSPANRKSPRADNPELLKYVAVMKALNSVGPGSTDLKKEVEAAYLGNTIP